MKGCFSQCSTAVKRHHDPATSYKGKHLIVACLPFQRFSPLYSRWREWWQTGRHGTSKFYIQVCRQQGERETLGKARAPVTSCPPKVTNFLQQSHTYLPQEGHT